MDSSAWKYKGTKVECTLMHVDSSYGKFYFRSLPDHQLSFEFRLKNNSHHWTSAILSNLTPPWEQPVLSVPVTTGKAGHSGFFSFRHKIDDLLHDIEKGRWIQVLLSGRESSASETVTIPLIRIHPELEKFQSCRKHLPEMSYKQARTVVLHYHNGQRQLSSRQYQQLKNFMTYVRVDSRIQHILIDGYTDNVGSSVANLQLSRSRAEEVAQVLMKSGVKEKLIQIRAHGARYPVASNRSAKGRSENRRVTVRLVRDNEQIISRKINQTKKVQ